MIKFLKTLLTFIFTIHILYADARNAQLPIEPLIDVHWLQKHINDPNIVILESSVVVSFDEQGQFNLSSGQNKYQEKHIPGALFADLLGNLSNKDEQRHFVMPSAKQFQTAISDLGVGNDSVVIIYSKQPEQGWAQRLWWMLYWAGHDNIAVLDGGFPAWEQANLPVSNKSVTPLKADFQINIRENVIAQRDDVLNAINNKNITIIDVLPAQNYNGETSTYARPGHITSAINIPTRGLFTESGLYKSVAEHKKIFNSQSHNRIITYCGGGIAASSTAFALHRLGHKDVSVYIGSLQEWAINDENPMSIKQQ